jgi:hypothetical protein
MKIYKGQSHRRQLGSTAVKNDSFGERRASIIIYPRLGRNRTQSLSEMIETLVHEMIHAYLGLFVCRGLVCTKEAPGTVGTQSHGAAFFLLQARITNIIRSWDPELRSFMTGVSSYGTKKSLIDAYSLFLELEQRARLASVKNGSDNSTEPFAHEGFSRLPGFRAEYADLMENIELYPQYKRALEEGGKKKPPQVHKGPKVSGQEPIPCKGVTPKGKRPGGAGR